MTEYYASGIYKPNGLTKTMVGGSVNALGLAIFVVVLALLYYDARGTSSSFGNPFMCDDRPGMGKCGDEGMKAKKKGRLGFLSNRYDGPDSAQYTSASNAILQAGVAAGGTDSDPSQPEGLEDRRVNKHSETNLEGIARGTR